MANIMVAGDLYESITGQLFEIGRQLRQPNGYPFDPLQLKAHLQAGIEGRFGVVSGNFRYDKRKGKDGWTLLENQPRRISSVIDSVPFLREGEDAINGEEMVRWARVELADYGQEDAEWLLENQDKIPAELRNFYLVFTATIWQVSHGRRSVPYLNWNGKQWVLNFNWLENDWNSNDRLVRPRNSLISPALLKRGPGFRKSVFYPAAEHFAHFIQIVREISVFFIINAFYFPEYLQKKFKSI